MNGRVMDPESGLDAVRNVGVRDGKIAAITRDAIKGRVKRPSTPGTTRWHRASSMVTVIS